MTAERSMMLPCSLLAAQVEVAVVEADILGIFGLAGDRHRQFGGGRLDRRLRAATTSISPVGELGVDRLRPRARRLRRSIVTTDSTRSASSSCERLAAGGGDDLGQAVMVAQIDEQHAAMVALAVDPARQADGRADIGGAQVGAVMGTVGVHGQLLLAQDGWSGREMERRASPFTRPLSTRAGAAMARADS